MKIRCFFLGLLVVAFVSSGIAGELSPGAVVLPNEGLNALQEYDPFGDTLLQTIPLPPPYSYSGARMQWSALVRPSDHAIFANVRDGSGNPAVIVITPDGQLLAEYSLSSDFLHELVFDPEGDSDDPEVVLGANPYLPQIVEVNPGQGSDAVRINETVLFGIGLATGNGSIYVGDVLTNKVRKYSPSGAFQGVFADVGADGGGTPSSIAIDQGGNVFVAAGDRVLKYASDGSLVDTFQDSAFTNLTHISYSSPHDSLLVSNQDDDVLWHLGLDGSGQGSSALGGLNLGKAATVPCRQVEGTEYETIWPDGTFDGTYFGWSAAITRIDRFETPPPPVHQLDHYLIVGSPDSVGDAALTSHTIYGWYSEWLEPFEARSLFGMDVALDGTNAVVGAPATSFPWGFDGPGDAFIYTSVGTYVHLSPYDLLDYSEFGSSVDIWGDDVVVGAPGDFPASVYLFRDANDDGWVSADQMKFSPIVPVNDFGKSVAVRDRTIAVGAPDYFLGGQVFVYSDTSTNGDWGSFNLTQLQVPNASGSDGFGMSVALDGRSLVAGDYVNGRAFVFTDTSASGNWSEYSVHELTPPTGPRLNSSYGYSVDIEGSYAVIGAFDDSYVCHRAGVVYVFEDVSANSDWSEVEMSRLFGSDLESGDDFGRSVSIAGEQVLVGARFHGNRGAAFLFSLGVVFKDGFESGDFSAWSSASR